MTTRSSPIHATALLAALLASLAVPPSARASTVEYGVKAGFLYNFLQLVQWPANAFADAKTPFVMAVVGKDPFGPALDKALGGKSVNFRNVIVQRYESASAASLDPAIRKCHMVFVAFSSAADIEKTIQFLGASPVLTVGDASGFTKTGGMIGFREIKGMIRFEVNAASARKAGLEFNEKLLKLAVNS